MRLLSLAVALGVVVVAEGSPARVRAVRPPVRLLWVGAHPDDEALVAPIFGPRCKEQGNDCAIVILTNGSVERAGEAQSAATALRVRLIQWDLPDVFDVSTWGDHAMLVARLTSLISDERPTLIYTFDPRHGSSCHPAHREAGRLTLDAVATLGVKAPSVMLVETLIVRDSESQIVGFSPATPSATAIDASSTWHYLVDDAAIHASQFSSVQIELLRVIAPEQRRVWLLPANTPATEITTCP